MKKFLLINILLLSVLCVNAYADETPTNYIQRINEYEIDVNDTTIYTLVDERAQFVGGDIALMEWLNENIMFPPEFAEHGIQGKVFVKFVIEKDGSITNSEIVRGVHPAMDREAIRLVKSMPKWEPAIKNEKIVRSYFILPVTFVLR